MSRSSHCDDLAIGLQRHARDCVNVTAEIRGHLARAVEGYVQRPVGIVSRNRKISVCGLPGHHDFTITLHHHVVAVVITAAKGCRHDPSVSKTRVKIAGNASRGV